MANWNAVAAVLLTLAVGLGAFGAHGLRERLAASNLTAVYEKAVFYHFIHALGILLVSILAATGQLSRGAAGLVANLLLAGILLFSGSLYVLAITGTRWLGAITPMGGLCFLAAWLLLAWSAARSGGS